MKPLRLGETLCKGVPVYVEEVPVDATALETQNEFFVQLGIDERVLNLGLADLRALKRLLVRGEQQILLRHDQALRARNLTLDL